MFKVRSESNHFPSEKSLQGFEPWRLGSWRPSNQVKYGIKNKVMPGKNNNIKVRMVSLIRKGMMPL